MRFRVRVCACVRVWGRRRVHGVVCAHARVCVRARKNKNAWACAWDCVRARKKHKPACARHLQELELSLKEVLALEEEAAQSGKRSEKVNVLVYLCVKSLWYTQGLGVLITPLIRTDFSEFLPRGSQEPRSSGGRKQPG